VASERAEIEAEIDESPRRRSTTLTRDDIIEAARRIVALVGVDGLTMRRLADDLGVTPMAAYHYFTSKEQLLDAVGALVVREARDADRGAALLSWDERIRSNAHTTFHALTAYPGLATFLLDRPISRDLRATPGISVEEFEQAGFSRDEAQLAHATFHTYVFGLVSMETRFRPLKRGRKPDSDAILINVGVDEFIDYGIDVLIAGIRAQRSHPS
jgi:AcrR family transcriptional regulator